MTTTKEEFVQSWRESITQMMPGITEEEIIKTGDQLWVGREIDYATVDDDNFNLLAHRYFHGVGSIRLQLFMMASHVVPLEVFSLLLAEQMFSLGFMCGTADAKGLSDADDVSPAALAAACLADRPSILPTREELDQEAALPSAFPTSEDLPEGFSGTPEGPLEEGEYF